MPEYQCRYCKDEKRVPKHFFANCRETIPCTECVSNQSLITDDNILTRRYKIFVLQQELDDDGPECVKVCCSSETINNKIIIVDSSDDFIEGLMIISFLNSTKKCIGDIKGVSYFGSAYYKNNNYYDFYAKKDGIITYIDKYGKIYDPINVGGFEQGHASEDLIVARAFKSALKIGRIK